MEKETIIFNWQNIEIKLNYVFNYLSTGNMAHIEIRCDEELPITETGYRSIFVSNADISNIKLAVALVKDSLENTAKQKNWHRNTQMSLF